MFFETFLVSGPRYTAKVGTHMTDSDTHRILGWLDSALELFQKDEGKLSAHEIRIRSLLAVVRNELSENLGRQKSPRRSD